MNTWIWIGRKAVQTVIDYDGYKCDNEPCRYEEKLKCPCCHMHTMVDDSIRYDFCPHCGVALDYDW